MDINALNASQIATQFQTILDESGVTGVKVAASDDGKNLVVTSAKSDGSKVSTQIGVPDIDEPKTAGAADGGQALEKVGEKLKDYVKSLGTVDAKVLAKATEKLEALARQVESAMGASGAQASSGTSSAKGVLYSIYKLIALLLDAARQQRESARQQREADSQMVIAEMQAQCSSIVSDAFTGLASSLVCAGVQGVMLGGSMYHQHYANKSTRDSHLYTGEESAARIQSMATQQAKPDFIPTAKAEAATRLDAAVAKLHDTKGCPQELQNSATTAKSTIENQFKQAAEGVDPTKSVDVKAQIDDHNGILEQCKAEQADARAQFAKESSTGVASDVTRNRLELANAKVEYASACKIEAELKMDGSLRLEVEGKPDYTVAQARADFQTQTVRDSVSAQANSRSSMLTERAARNAAYAGTWTQAGNVTHILGSGISNTISRLDEARTKSYDQAIEASRQQRETSNDLVQSSLDMFKQLLQVLSSIAESEKTTFREIMG